MCRGRWARGGKVEEEKKMRGSETEEVVCDADRRRKEEWITMQCKLHYIDHHPSIDITITLFILPAQGDNCLSCVTDNRSYKSSSVHLYFHSMLHNLEASG